MTINDRLTELGLSLTDGATPQANYVPAVRSGDLLFISGHVSTAADPKVAGKLGRDLTTEQGYAASRAVALLLLGTARVALGDLDHVTQVVKLTGLVNSADGYTEHSQVINGASDLLVEIFGERGKHARAAFGVAALPGGAAVEIELILEVR